MKSSAISRVIRPGLGLAGFFLLALFIGGAQAAPAPWASPMTPPPGTLVSSLPPEYGQIYKNNLLIYFHQGVFFRRAQQGYVVMIPPVGLMTPGPPEGFVTLNVANQTIYYYNDVYYRPMAEGFMVVQAPPPEAVTSATPREGPPDAAGPAPPPPLAQNPPANTPQTEPVPAPQPAPQVQKQPAAPAQIAPVQPPPSPPGQKPDAPAPEKERVKISALYVQVRSSPAPIHPVIGQVEKGQVVEVDGRWENWLWIRLSDGRHGWIPDQYTLPEKNQG